MKLARPLLVTLAVLFVISALAAGLAFWQPAQQWAVRRALANRTDFQLQFAELFAGPRRAVLRGVRFEHDGLKIAAAEIEATYSVWQYLTANRLRIDHLQVRGVEIDATDLATSPTAGDTVTAPTAAPGALTRLTLPWELVVNDVSLVGRAVLPNAAERAPLTVEFQLNGGGIAAGKEGRLQLKARLHDATPGAPVMALQTDATMLVRQTTERTFDRVNLALVVDAESTKIADQTQLKVVAEMQTVDGRESYRATVDTLVGGRVENLLKLDARSPMEAMQFAGEWKLQARTEQVAPFFLGGTLPTFTARGAGEFSLMPATGSFSAQGRMEGEAGELELLDPRLRAVGAVRFDAEFDLANEDGIARLNELRLAVRNEQPVLSVTLQRALALNPETKHLAVAPGPSAEVAQVQIDRLPAAWAAPFAEGVEIRGGMVSGRFVATNDNGVLRLRPVEPLRIDDLTLAQAGEPLLESAVISLRPVLAVSPARFEVEVDELSLETAANDRVTGHLAAMMSLDEAGSPISIRTKMTGELPRLLNAIAPIGAARLESESDVTIAGERVEVRSFTFNIADTEARQLVAVRVSRPFVVDTLLLRLQADVPSVELARVTFGPLSLAALSMAQSALSLHGELEPTEWIASLRDGRVVLNATKPLRLSALSVGEEGDRKLERVTVETAPEAEFSSLLDWKLSLGPTTLRDANGDTLATLELDAQCRPTEGVRGSLGFNLDLPKLGAQPFFSAARALSAGRASGEIRVASNVGNGGSLPQIEGRATLNGLVAREGNQPLPVANLSFRAARSEDGRISFEAPMLIDRLGQRSELRLIAEAIERPDGYLFDARLTGDHLELADALVLGGIFGHSDNASSSAREPKRSVETPTPSEVVPDAVPFWQGVRGELVLDLKSVTQGKDWGMSGVSGYLIIDPRRVALQKFEALINQKTRLAARADLRFNEGALPYSLRGNLSLLEFDAGAFFKAFNPEQPPTLEGVVTIAGGFIGDGATLERTIERTRGHVQLTSNRGVFRGLRRATEKVSVATKAVELGAALGSLFGSKNRVKEAAEKVAGQTYHVDQLVQMLAELPYDQFVLRATRGEGLDFRVEELSLLSPEVRITGRGTLEYIEGRSWLQMPINVSYTLAARGKVEEQLAKLRVLDGTKDELGYSKMVDLGTIGGTISRPDASAFFLKLAETKIGEMLAPQN